jgi:protein phosphatase
VEPSVLLEVSECALELGDVYLMCSDGLNDMVVDVAIARIMLTEAELEEKAQMLVDAANANGGRDNISVLLVEVGEAGEKRGLIARLLGK